MYKQAGYTTHLRYTCKLNYTCTDRYKNIMWKTFKSLCKHSSKYVCKIHSAVKQLLNVTNPVIMKYIKNVSIYIQLHDSENSLCCSNQLLSVNEAITDSEVKNSLKNMKFNVKNASGIDDITK